jgi:putative transposase
VPAGVARFVADQRTFHRVPHSLACALLGVSLSWFYKWISRTPTPTQRRRAEVDAAVATAFADAFTRARGLRGSPRLHADLREAGWQVSQKTVADSMRRQGLVARRIKRVPRSVLVGRSSLRSGRLGLDSYVQSR